MSFENKTIGILFIDKLIIKDNLEYELIKLKKYNNIMPIMNKYNSNINIAKISKITKNELLFYDKGIILENIIKSVDILILVGCGEGIIYKLANNKFDNNILKIVKLSKTKQIPLVIGINIKEFTSFSLMSIEKLYKKSDYYFIPFKLANPITQPNRISFDSTFLTKTIYFAFKGIQIKPLLNFL